MGVRIEVCSYTTLGGISFPDHFAQDEVLIGKEHPTILTVSAPKEVRSTLMILCRYCSKISLTLTQIVDVEGACQGLLGLEPL